VAATFGRNGVFPSYTQFAVPDSVSDNLASHVSVSFLVRTRKQAGLIFFIGSDTSESKSNQTFMTVELSPVGVVSRIKLGSDTETNVLPGSVADGRQHSVFVSLNYSVLKIQLDDMSELYAVNYSVPLVDDLLYVGGMPLKNMHRRRRDTYFDAANQFSGTLQDFRLNGVRLQSFSMNSTDEDGSPAPAVELPVNSSNVDRGEQSDDVCQLQQPCQHNATCQNEFYNRYRSLIEISYCSLIMSFHFVSFSVTRNIMHTFLSIHVSMTSAVMNFQKSFFR